MSPRSRRGRISLPAALALAAAVLSCSTACLTTAVVSEAKRDAADARQRTADSKEAARIQGALLPALPPSHRGVPPELRLQVGGDTKLFNVRATGDFSAPERVDEFVATVRRLYAQTVTIDTRFMLEVYDDATPPSSRIAPLQIAYADELLAELRRSLPPASPTTPEAERLEALPRGDTNTLHVTAIGRFTPEATRAFEQAVRQAQARLPRPTHLVVRVILQREDGAREVAAVLDLGAP